MKNILLTRHIPAGYSLYHKNGEMLSVFHKINENPKFAYQAVSAMAFVGKQSRPVWYYSFPSIEKMMEKVLELEGNLTAWEHRKFLRKLERRSEAERVEVGDLFYNSWGYDQTNIDFYQVIEKTKSTFTIREIAGRSLGEAPSGPMSDYVTPIKDAFLTDSKPMIKRTLNMKHGMLSRITEGEKKLSTWYA